MSVLPPSADALLEAARQRDRRAAWAAVADLLPWLADLRRSVPPAAVFHLTWAGGAVNRWFDIAELISGTAAARADAAPGTRRLHAQMLMERGFDDEALSRLEPLRHDATLPAAERQQVFGQLGRIHKDRFAAAVRTGDGTARLHLTRALDAYLTGYQEDPASLWMGINAVALLARPEAGAVRDQAAEDATRLARAVIRQARERDPGNADRYTPATVAEASLALRDHATAVDALRRYVTHPGARGFELGATLRQFVDIWELDRADSPGPALVTLLRAAAMDRLEGGVRMSGDDIRRARESVGGGQFEAVFGADRFDSLENYRRGLARSASVARIGRSADVGVGTGFLLPGDVLHPELARRFVLVTNAHVLSARPEERDDNAVHPAEAVVTFAALDGVPASKEFGVARLRYFSPPEALDVAVAELSEPIAPGEPIPIAPVVPAGTDAQVRVIGHPSGRGLSFSSGALLDHEAPRLHYRTATEGGSSGSPVFNAEWKLIGLHHAGGSDVPRLNGQTGTYEANEGILIADIRAALARTGLLL